MPGRVVEPSRTIAVGDSPGTDLAGAAAMGCEALLVAGGVHAAELLVGGRLEPARLAQLIERAGLRPGAVAAMAALTW